MQHDRPRIARKTNRHGGSDQALCINLLLLTGEVGPSGVGGQRPLRGFGPQGTEATASPNMMMASRNMTAVVMRKLTIGRLLVRQGFPMLNEETGFRMHCSFRQATEIAARCMAFSRIVLKGGRGDGPTAHLASLAGLQRLLKKMRQECAAPCHRKPLSGTGDAIGRFAAVDE